MFNAIKKSILVASSLVLLSATTVGVVGLSKTIANAEESVAISTGELVAQSTLTVTPAYQNAGLYFERTANGQSAQLKGSFNGDLTFEYSLIKSGVAPINFDFYNTDNQLIFRIVRFAKYNDDNALWASTAYVGYKLSAESDIQYSYLNADSELVSGVETINRTDPIGYAIPTSNATSYEKCGTGSLTLDWSDNNQLEIKHTYQSGEKTIANLNLSAWEGVSSAYSMRITYDSNWGAKTNVLLRSVNGVSLAGETVAVNGVSTGISYDGEILIEGQASIKLPQGQNLDLFSADANTMLGNGWKLGTVSGETFSYNEDFSTKAEGVYPIVVTHGGFTKTYNVVVLPVKNISDILSVGGSITATESKSYNEGEVVGYQAYSAAKEKSGTIVSFGGVFVGDFELEYFLPDPESLQSAPNEGIVFDVEDVSGNLLFKVVKKAKWGGNPGKDWEHFTYVYDANGNEIANRVADYPVNGSTRNETAAYQYATGKINFAWTNNGVVVSTTNRNSTTLSELATVQGVAMPEGGYKVSVKSTESGYRGGVLLVNLNGKELSGAKLSMEYQSKLSIDGFFDGKTLYVPQNGEIGSTIATAWINYAKDWIDSNTTVIVDDWSGIYDLTTAGTYSIAAEFSANNKAYRNEINLIVEPSYKIAFDEKLGQEVADIYYSQHTYEIELPTPIRSGWEFVGWYNGDKKVEQISFELGNITLEAKWLDDVKPELSLNGFEDLTTVEEGADNGLNISKSNVNAADAAWGTLSEENITISIKAPNGSDFVDFNEFVFNELSFGVYVVKYVAIDGSGNQNEIIREIRYIPARAILSLNETLNNQGFVGKVIKLPNASASYNGEALVVSLSVVFNEEIIDISNNEFLPLIAGSYTVVYSIVDEYGRYVAETFAIEIVADTQEPVISVTFDITQLFIGDTLSIPTATATDNADEAVTVSVKILFGGEVVATDSCVLNEKGVYTVVYTAKDEAGNETVESFDVVVGEKQDNTPSVGTDAGGSGCNGCNSSLTAIPVAVLLIFVTAIIMIVKKRKNIN